jgi:hypothetical protein
MQITRCFAGNEVVLHRDKDSGKEQMNRATDEQGTEEKQNRQIRNDDLRGVGKSVPMYGNKAAIDSKAKQ